MSNLQEDLKNVSLGLMSLYSEHAFKFLVSESGIQDDLSQSFGISQASYIMLYILAKRSRF